MKTRFNAQAHRRRGLWISAATFYRRLAARIHSALRNLGSALRHPTLNVKRSASHPDHTASAPERERNEMKGTDESQHRTTNAERRTANEEQYAPSALAVLTDVSAQQNTPIPPHLNAERTAERAQHSRFNIERSTFNSGSTGALPVIAEIRQRDAGIANNRYVAESSATARSIQQILSDHARNHVTHQELKRELASLHRLIESRGK
jgi:hypothetical protein